ncbi:MAG: hypothetical protein J5659_00935 [Clostridia bacterium]|nr:hypothetical protein [Clostridia bacterium]
MSQKSFSDCENCSHCVLDVEAEDYYCNAPLDEDDVARLISTKSYKCPYFDFYDEYKIVRKQN